MELLKELYTTTTGLRVESCDIIPGAGSNRRYYRLRGSDGTSLIGVVGTSRDENHTFCYLSEHFTRQRLPVPAIVAQSADGLRYLQTLGFR